MDSLVIITNQTNGVKVEAMVLDGALMSMEHLQTTVMQKDTQLPISAASVCIPTPIPLPWKAVNHTKNQMKRGTTGLDSHAHGTKRVAHALQDSFLTPRWLNGYRMPRISMLQSCAASA